MSDLYLPYQARRVLDHPHLITARAAHGVLNAIGHRLGIEYVKHGDGTIVMLTDAQTRSIGAPRRGEGRLFAIDEATGIAYISVEGELVHRFGHLDPYSGMTGYDAIKAQFGAAIEDPNVRGVFMDYHTPGGEAHGCHDTAKMIRQGRNEKPIWALVNEEANSGAYWLASAAHNVIVTVTAEVGSVGAVVVHRDLSGLMKKKGIGVTVITAGEHKADGHPFTALPDDVESSIKDNLEELRTLFASSVAENRGMTVEAVLATEAAIYRGPAAVDIGFADAVATEDEAYIEFAAQLARAEGAATRHTA